MIRISMTLCMHDEQLHTNFGWIKPKENIVFREKIPFKYYVFFRCVLSAKKKLRINKFLNPLTKLYLLRLVY